MAKDKLTEDTYHTLKKGKVDLEVLQADKPIKKRHLINWIDNFRFNDNRKNAAKAYIIDNHNMFPHLRKSYYIDYWEIGKDISKDCYFKFKDFRGNIYINIIYIEGKRYTMIVRKDFWKSTAT